MGDYASYLAERWDGATDKEAKPLTTRECVDGAIREALAKAAEEVSQSAGVNDAWDRVRALGAKSETNETNPAWEDLPGSVGPTRQQVLDVVQRALRASKRWEATGLCRHCGKDELCWCGLCLECTKAQEGKNFTDVELAKLEAKIKALR